MEEKILEHEILTELIQGSGFAFTSAKSVPIYKRIYEHCSLRFGTLVDVLNNPASKDKKDGENELFYLQKRITKTPEVVIEKYDWYQVSDAIEFMVINGDLADSTSVNLFEDQKIRVIEITKKGVFSYLSKHYYQEYKKSQLALLDEEG